MDTVLKAGIKGSLWGYL